MSTPSFLHIADGSIDMSLNSFKKESLKANIKHSLLFEERILFTDSQIINNKNLRELLLGDEGFFELFNKDNLVIALRDMIDIRKSITSTEYDIIHDPNIKDVICGFISWDKCFWQNKETPDVRKQYAHATELEHFVESADVKRYSLVSVGITFTEDYINLVSSDKISQHIGKRFASQICDMITLERSKYKSEINSVGGVGLAYLTKELGKDLIKSGFNKDWEQHKEFILNFTHAPYLTALPKTFKANPIYGQMHKYHIDLMNGQAEIKAIGKDQIYNTKLLQYETGINLLSTDSIMKLRHSSEFKEFRKSINNYDGTETSLSDVKLCYRDYKRRIDDEILKCFSFLKEIKIQSREIIRPIEIFYDLPNYGGITLSTLGLFLVDFPGGNLLSLGLGALGLIGSNFASKIKKTIDNRIELNKDILIESLENENAKKIEGEYFVHIPQKNSIDKSSENTHSVYLSSVR